MGYRRSKKRKHYREISEDPKKGNIVVGIRRSKKRKCKEKHHRIKTSKKNGKEDFHQTFDPSSEQDKRSWRLRNSMVDYILNHFIGI